MGTKPEFIDYLREQLAGAGAVSYRRMFGEYGVYLDGKVVALVCDNQLFVKPTEAGRGFLGAVVEAPPYPGARPYFLVDEVLESPQEVAQLIRITARELPLPGSRPKTGSGARAKARSEPKPKPKPKPKSKSKPKRKGKATQRSKARSR